MYRFPTFLPTAFLTTASPTLTITLTLTLTMTVFTFWLEMRWLEMQWAEKGLSLSIHCILIVFIHYMVYTMYTAAKKTANVIMNIYNYGMYVWREVSIVIM